MVNSYLMVGCFTFCYIMCTCASPYTCILYHEMMKSHLDMLFPYHSTQDNVPWDHFDCNNNFNFS